MKNNFVLKIIYIYMFSAIWDIGILRIICKDIGNMEYYLPYCLILFKAVHIYMPFEYISKNYVNIFTCDTRLVGLQNIWGICIIILFEI